MCEAIPAFGVQGHLVLASLAFLFLRGKAFIYLFKQNEKKKLEYQVIVEKATQW